MGAGKSTIGKLLASILGLPFKDTDHLIEERTGADIPWIFDVEGESGFRDREQMLLDELLHSSETFVLATGGGIVERAENRDLLKSADKVIYLKVEVEQLITRTAKDKKRPLLQVENPEQKIREIYERREPLYLEVSTYVIATNRRSPNAAAEEIAALLSA